MRPRKEGEAKVKTTITLEFVNSRLHRHTLTAPLNRDMLIFGLHLQLRRLGSQLLNGFEDKTAGRPRPGKRSPTHLQKNIHSLSVTGAISNSPQPLTAGWLIQHERDGMYFDRIRHA